MREIFHTIEKYHMIEPGMRVIAGVSGGADSVCLLYVLTQYQKTIPFEISVVHIEHGLRGEESLEDAAFVEELCERLGVPCRIVRAGVKRLAREEKLSLEEAGRAERYRIFEEIRIEQNADRIAVAHNRDDQAETALWNLVRGSGLKGLGGIRPVRGSIIRPLLFTGREQIEAILRKTGIAWRTDRTNREQAYTRNKVRLSILPELKRELNSRAPEHIAAAAEKLQQVQEFVERMTRQAAGACIRSGRDVTLYLPEYEKQDPLIRRELLRLALETAGSLQDVGSVHIEALEALAKMDCGKSISLPGRIRAVREHRMIRFVKCGEKKTESRGPARAGRDADETEDVKPADPPREIKVPVPGECVMPEAGGRPGRRVRTELLENSPEIMRQIPEEKKYTKWLSYDTIKNDILLRHRQSGDYLVINSQGGRKKIKDYFIDLRIPADQRDRLWLLADGSHVLWVPGYRISERAKVHGETEKVIKIQMEEEIK